MAQIALVIPDNASTPESTENDRDIITVQPCNTQFATEASRIESYKKNGPLIWLKLQMSYPLQDSFLLVREMSSYVKMLYSTQFCWGVMMFFLFWVGICH